MLNTFDEYVKRRKYGSLNEIFDIRKENAYLVRTDGYITSG